MTDNIKPDHYRKGEIDLFEEWYLTYPFEQYRAIMQSHAEKYLRRNKINRIEDLGKAIYTLERLREKEIEHRKKQEKEIEHEEVSTKKDLGLLRALQRCGYKYLTRNRRGDFRVHKYLPLRTRNYWVSIGYFDIGYDIKLTKVDWSENKLIEISDLLTSYEKM